MNALSDLKAILDRLIGSGNTLSNNILFIDFTGSHEKAQLLSQMWYWAGKTKDKGGWFYKSYAEWHEEIRVPEHSVRRYVKLFCSHGFLETKFKKVNGTPTIHYRLDKDLLIQKLAAFCEGDNLRPLQIVSLEGDKLLASMEGDNLLASINRDYHRLQTEKAEPAPPPKKSKTEEPSEMVKKVVDYLNERTKRNFQYDTRSTVQNITRQEKAGRSYPDFCTVIDYKANEWLGDPEFSKHLNPETLFGNKMEKYLNAALAAPVTANTDDSLNNAMLDSDLAEKYAKYITWVIENFPTLYRSQSRVFSKSDYVDYHECESMPGLRFAITPREKYRLLQDVHNRLDNDKRYRDRFPSALAAFYHEAKAITEKMKLP
jgi:uncharacterized phage protein (TIGR02220 family)